jgi:hypothetical protein
MKFDSLLDAVGDEPVFETGLLLAGDVDPVDVRHQLSRWMEAGRIYQLRRGLYSLAPPFRKVVPHPFLVANRLAPGSYVSLQSALAHYGLIPEYVPVTTSVGAGRPASWDTPLGRFELRHLRADLVTGFRPVPLGAGQEALLASPEKALLDLVYLTNAGESRAYLGELRLQNLEILDLAELDRLAEASRKPKLRRAATRIVELAQTESAEYQPL